MTLPLSPTCPLFCHPTTHCTFVSDVTISAKFAGDGSLSLHYLITGEMAKIVLPDQCQPGAADNLWQHTCCEAFIADAEGAQYREFNFSPSGQWAVYQFAAYRQRDSDFAPPAAPRITLGRNANGFELAASLPRELLPSQATLILGITTVLEASDGSKSYWALSHCAEQPDFHLRQSFTLALPRTTP